MLTILLDAELIGVEKGVGTGVDARPGWLEAADGGTLFLDEVGNLDPGAQARLLRLLQDGTFERVGGRATLRVPARVVSATNRELASTMDAGSFRHDLYHHLAPLRIEVSPLRERRAHVRPLVQHVLDISGGAATFAEDAFEALERHGWPGNVRDLEQVVAVSAGMTGGGAVDARDLEPVLRQRALTALRDRSAEALHAAIVSRQASFWEAVHGAFLRRDLSRDDMERLLDHAFEEAGSWNGVARLHRIEPEYRRLITFLHGHGLARRK